MRDIKSFSLTVLLLSFLFLLAPVQAQPVFEDQFNDFNVNNWTFHGNEPGGTGFRVQTGNNTVHGNKPTVQSEPGATFVRLKLDTFNNDYPGYFKGTEMYSRRGFGPPGRSPNTNELVNSSIIESPTGFEFESRIRYTNPQPSGVAAFWTYWNHGSSPLYTDSNYRAHEIDNEIFYINTYDKYDTRNYSEWNLTHQYGNKLGYVYSDSIYVPSIKHNEWHYSKIVWTPKGDGKWKTDWYIKKNLTDNYQLYDSDSGSAPNKWMTVRFNIWNQNPPPSANTTSRTNISYYFDVDWIKVTPVSTPSVSVTQINGVSNPNNQTFKSLNSISGNVVNGNGIVSQVNAVIVRQRDGFKWQGYSDAGGSPRWVNANVGIATNYSASNLNWATTGTMPPVADLEDGSYTILADATGSNGYLSSSEAVTINVIKNVAPQTVSLSPAHSSSLVGTSRILSTVHSDANGSGDLNVLVLDIRLPNGVVIEAHYARSYNKLYLTGSNASAGFALGSTNVLSNQYLDIDCATTTITYNGNTATVNWTLMPKAALIGANTIILQSGDYSGVFSSKQEHGSWTVSASVTNG